MIALIVLESSIKNLTLQRDMQQTRTISNLQPGYDTLYLGQSSLSQLQENNQMEYDQQLQQSHSQMD